MMMPANYSAIAENEMTYVVGGGLFDALPEVMGAAQWKNLGTNLITIIGNTFSVRLIGSTLGQLFGGDYEFGDIGRAVWGYNTEDNGWQSGAFVKAVGGNVDWTNTILAGVGGLAAIYNLGFGTVKKYVGENVLDINGAKM